jgi:hypothetical protein
MLATIDILFILLEPIHGVILSKISIKEFIRYFVLSKRWRFIYGDMSRLVHSPFISVHAINANLDPILVEIMEKPIFSLPFLHLQDMEGLCLII